MIMADFDIDRILMVIFEEVRKMPGKDLKIKLEVIKRDLEYRFNDVMDTLNKAEKVTKDMESLRRGRGNDNEIK